VKLIYPLPVVAAATFCLISPVQGADYAIVVSTATHEDEAWRVVVEALVQKHQGRVYEYTQSLDEVLDELRASHPRYTCFVAKPEEASRQFVAAVHRLTRQYDEDPYTDTFWGILTGFDAAGALAIAKHREPLVIHKAAAGTEFALDCCTEGRWYDELVPGKQVRKLPGGEIETLQGPTDSTAALVETLNDYQPDLFITSGHATERDWMIGFTYRNGFFRSRAGQMSGEDTQSQRHPIRSPNPKVYMAVGNCLMGHIDGPDAMALAWMNSVGVKQMIGYTVPTWFGYAGWGCLDYFVEQPGRYSFAEAFLANHHALIHRLETAAGRDQRGLQFDRDVLAFYGDPKWDARLAEAPRAYEQRLTIDGDRYTFTVTPQRGAESFQPVNTNGSQRGWRPIIEFLPHRIVQIEVLEGADLQPVIADDFLLIPNPRRCDPQQPYRLVFRARRLGETSEPGPN
jgi:hypothetical protein